MRWATSITVAVCFAAASSNARSAKLSDKFIPGCPLPFATISIHRPLDASCENAGRPKLDEGAVDANKEQNRAKNNFCADGSSVTVTQKTFKDLQVKAEALEKTTSTSARKTLTSCRVNVDE